MKIHTTKVLAFFLLAFLVAPFAQAGISADYQIKVLKSGKEDRVSKGKFYFQENMISVEFKALKKPEPQKPQEKSQKGKTAQKKDAKKQENVKDEKSRKKREPIKKGFIVNQGDLKAEYLLHYNKRHMPLDLKSTRGWEMNYYNRFLKQGGILLDREELKKRGWDVKYLREEKLAGHPTKVWYLEQKGRDGNRVAKMWTASDLKNIPVKIVYTEPNGIKTEVVLKNFKKEELQASLFQPPKDYTPYEPKIIELSSEEGKEIKAKMDQNKGLKKPTGKRKPKTQAK